MNRVDMVMSLALRSGLDPGELVRTLWGEYTGVWRDVEGILNTMSPVASPEDDQYVKRILTRGCPSKLMADELKKNNLKMIERGNQNNVMDNPELVNNSINKED